MDYFEMTHKFKKRGLGISPRFIQTFILLPIFSVTVMIVLVVGIGNGYMRWMEYKENKKIQRDLEFEKARWDKIHQEQERKKQEYQERLKKEQEEQEKKQKGEVIRSKNIALWNYIKDEYKIGTYVENCKTYQKGQVIGYQGERVFVVVRDKNKNVIEEWYFDYGIDDITQVGFKDYAKYRNYIMLIKK